VNAPREEQPADGAEGAADVVEPADQEEAAAPETNGASDGVAPAEEDEQRVATEAASEAAIHASLAHLGFVGFDAGGADNTTSGFMVPPEMRRQFRREIYVGVTDDEQEVEFLGRVVEGPFHSPHEISADSAISRTTVLYPDRTQFRPTYYVFGAIEILGEIRGEDRLVQSPRRPRPYSNIDIFPAERLERMLGLSGDFLLGHLLGYEEVTVRADVENKGFLPRNVGIFGTVGSGKSNTTQVLIEEALAADWAVVVVDVEGEYVQMDQPTSDDVLAATLRADFELEPSGVDDLRVYLPSSGSSDAANPIRFKAPLSELAPEVVSDLLDLSEAQQRMFGSAVAAAIRQGGRGQRGAARLGALGGARPAPGGTRPYTLETLIDGLTEDANGNIPLLGRAAQGVERSTVFALGSKLRHLARSGMLDSRETRNVAELPVPDLLVPGRLSVLDVSETDDRSRNIGIAFLLQALFEEVLETDKGSEMPNGTARPPLLVVVEEVHTFVSRTTAGRMRAVLDQLQIISRRGRKRWMGLALVSQQPGHVPDELFELANTRFIHQLKSSSNLTPVRHTTGGVHEALWSTVPGLGPGQCLLTGAIFRHPLFVAMRPAKSRRLLVA
jgi:DNA helicase HerA-like ATPase